MPVVHFIQPDNSTKSVDVAAGGTLMEAARDGGVCGIIAECGGVAMCGTCHVFVEERFLDRLAPIGDVEEEILGILSNRQPGSRLSCQVQLDDGLDGLVVHVPAEQSF